MFLGTKWKKDPLLVFMCDLQQASFPIKTFCLSKLCAVCALSDVAWAA